MELRIRRFGVLSAGKIYGALCGLMGLIFGAFMSLFSVIGAGFAGASGAGDDAFLGMLFGVGAIIILPIFYGVLGFVMGLISALLYNLIAGMVGGLEIDLDGAAAAAGLAGHSAGSPVQPTAPAVP
jgi:hypothetical protein